MDHPDVQTTPTTPDRHASHDTIDSHCDSQRDSQRDSLRDSQRETTRDPVSPSACDAIVASDDITKQTALRVQKLVHDMQVKSLQEQDAARREVEAARNEIALMRLSGEHVLQLEDMRSKLAEGDRVLAAQQDMIAAVTRAVEELSAVVPKLKRR